MLKNREIINESYKKATTSLIEGEINPLLEGLTKDPKNFATPSLDLLRELMYLEALFGILDAYNKVTSITGISTEDLEKSLKDSNTDLKEIITLTKADITSKMLDYVDAKHLVDILMKVILNNK